MRPEECHDETIFSFSEQTPPPPERRDGNRHMSILRVGSLVGPHGPELCLIRNISAGGVMAHVYSSHRPGDEVKVELKANQQVAGQVRWAKDSNIGIQFDAPIDVEEMLAAPNSAANGWKPRMPRIEVDRLATVRAGANLYGVNTCDISQGGVKVEVDEPLTTGEDVVISMDKFRPVPGTVRWSNDGLAGIAFRQPIPFAELMAWLRPAQIRA